MSRYCFFISIHILYTYGDSVKEVKREHNNYFWITFIFICLGNKIFSESALWEPYFSLWKESYPDYFPIFTEYSEE